MTDAPRPKVLVVDDEETIHKALVRTLRGEAYDLVHAYDTAQAASALEADEAIRAVICDHAMPGTPGLDFLIALRRKRPSLVTILLTGQADLGLVLTAMHEGRLHRFFTKPWDGEELRGALRTLLAGTPA